jgi:hypothetical protein
MSKLERLIAPDAFEMPDCSCGAEMVLACTQASPSGAETRIRSYQCPNCSREFRLTVWNDVNNRINLCSGC